MKLSDNFAVCEIQLFTAVRANVDCYGLDVVDSHGYVIGRIEVYLDSFAVFAANRCDLKQLSIRIPDDTRLDEVRVYEERMNSVVETARKVARVFSR